MITDNGFIASELQGMPCIQDNRTSNFRSSQIHNGNLLQGAYNSDTWNGDNNSASPTNISNTSLLTTPNINKPVGQLSVQELMTLLQPLEKKIDNLEQSMSKRMKSIETRNDVLERELHQQKNKSDVLTGIIVDMQRA